MNRQLLLVPLTLALASATPLHGADNLRARVAFGPQKESAYDIVGRRGDSISLTPVGIGGIVSMGVASITFMNIDRPKDFAQAQNLLGSGKIDPAVAALNALADRLLPFTDVPKSNAVDLVCDIVDLLRSADRFKEAIGVLDKITKPGPGSNVARAGLLKAYCLSALGKTTDAQAVLAAAKAPDRGDTLYPVDKIVRARTLLTVSNITEALDQISQGIVDTPIENEYYPESLFMAASCYHALVSQQQPAEKPAGAPGENSDADRLMAESATSPRTAATETFTLLIKLAPSSRWAQMAKERLKQLGAEAPPPIADPGTLPPPAPAAATNGQPAAPAADAGASMTGAAPAMAPDQPAPPANATTNSPAPENPPKESKPAEPSQEKATTQ